ncbi:MAG: GNAT family N-acetyltransferase [Hyphomicrobium sp.]|nr:GNAT family N-acetyltransferase [Hyphomicrobium sp.]
MSIATFNTHDALDAPQATSRRRWWRGPRFTVEVFEGADEALAALEAVQGTVASQSALTSTAFQSLNWLTVLFEELAPAHRAVPRVIIATERNTGDVALILPLLVRRKGLLRVAYFADLGVSNYGGPILGPALLKKSRSIRRAWRIVRKSLGNIDLLRLENMPAEIGQIANPLLTRSGLAPSRRQGAVVHIPGTVDDYIDSRGRTHRDALAKSWVLWRKKPSPQFQRAETPEQTAYAYSILSEQRGQPLANTNTHAQIKQLAQDQFFERIAIDGSEAGLAHLFTLNAAGETIATLFGVEHDGTFTILRMSDAGTAWSQLAPEQLITTEVMRYFVERGVRRFDLGRDDHPFKSGFGADEVPLYDLIIARDLAALPRAAFHRAKGRVRKSQRLQAFARSVGRVFGH